MPIILANVVKNLDPGRMYICMGAFILMIMIHLWNINYFVGAGLIMLGCRLPAAKDAENAYICPPSMRRLAATAVEGIWER
jgi:hypothetical protein